MGLFTPPKVSPCPDCGKPISMRATSCVNCGRRIEPGEMEASAEKSNRLALWTALIVVGLLVLYILWPS